MTNTQSTRMSKYHYYTLRQALLAKGSHTSAAMIIPDAFSCLEYALEINGYILFIDVEQAENLLEESIEGNPMVIRYLRFRTQQASELGECPWQNAMNDQSGKLFAATFCEAQEMRERCYGARPIK